MRLNAKQSREFIRIFFPTAEEIERHNKILNEIEQDIIIFLYNKNGFTAYCKNLDLSFLDER